MTQAWMRSVLFQGAGVDKAEAIVYGDFCEPIILHERLTYIKCHGPNFGNPIKIQLHYCIF